MGFFAKLKEGLSKTRAAFSDKVNNVFKSFSRVDEELFDELEETPVSYTHLDVYKRQVLEASGRGHTAADSMRAAELIRRSGIGLGVQMMTGLPEDTDEKSQKTARELIAMHPVCARIYPTLVLRDTELYRRWHSGEYRPQELSEAVELCAELYTMFSEAGIPVIRMGLMASDEICEGGAVAAGPCHPAFGELVQSHILLQRMKREGTDRGERVEIRVNPKDISRAVGNRRRNLLELEAHFGKPVRICPDEGVPPAFSGEKD